MEIFKEIVALLQVIAWPIVVLWLAYILRPQIDILLKRLDSLTFAGTRFSFAQALVEVESEAEELPQNEAIQTDNLELQPKLEQLKRISAISPRAAILEAWILVETAALQTGASSLHPYKIKPLEQLHNIATTAHLTQEESNLIIRLRNLRNQAAHMSDFALTQGEAERYLMLAVSVAKRIKTNTSENSL